MANSSSPLQSVQNVALLTSKLYDADSDIRFMSLTDLLTIFNNTQHAAFLSNDYQQCTKTVDGFLHTLNDTNGEVQNLTIKCLGSFVNRTHPEVLCPLINKVTNLPQTNVIDISISALAMRTIVVSLPRPSPGTARTKAVNDAYLAISKVLIPRLVGYIIIPLSAAEKRHSPPKGLLEEDLEKGTDSSSIDVLTEVARCFGPMLQPDEIKALEKITMQLIESERTGSVLKKKSVTALATLAHYFSNELLSSVISRMIESLTNSHLIHSKRKLYMTVLGSLARAIPNKFGPHLKTLAPFVLSALSQQELDEQMQYTEEDIEGRDPLVDEVREAALITLEAFLSSCGPDMIKYYDDCVTASLRYLKYEPNIAFVDEGEDEDDVGAEIAEDDAFEDDDFEEELGGDDEDDMSWKVRRCAARVLRTICSVRGQDFLENASVFNRIAFALIARMKEREETVRLEILLTLAFLIKKTGEGVRPTELPLDDNIQNGLILQPQTRKRRRADSNVSMTDPVKYGRYTGSMSPEVRSPPRQGPRASLVDISSEVVEGAIKLLQKTTLPSKQATVVVLKELTIAQNGGMKDYIERLMNSLIDILNAAGTETRYAGSGILGAGGSTSGATLQIETLQLIAELTKYHSSTVLEPHMANIVPAVMKITESKQPKLACQALATTEQLVKALTPPRQASTSAKSSEQLDSILQIILGLISARHTDLDIRKMAIRILAVFLGRTMSPLGAKLVPEDKTQGGLEALFEASRNETTRLDAIRAIDFVASYVPEKNQIDPTWLSKTCLELCGQLRKADRALRGSSIDALQSLITGRSSAKDLDASVTKQLVNLLLPLFISEDLQLLGPVLLITASIIKEGSADIISPDLIDNVCQLVASSTAPSILPQICELVQQIGERSVGSALMAKLLKEVGVLGSPTVVGKVISTLLVHGQGKVGVTTADFLAELKGAKEDRPICLALSVLGEIGLQSGAAANLQTDLFTSFFGHKTGNVSLTAAMALGRAAAGPGAATDWTPAIIARIKQHPDEQYLILHTIKELLQHNGNEAEIVPYTAPLWDASISASRTEGNRPIGAECLASLAMIEPKKYLSALQSLLGDESANARGTAILALRDVFTITDSTYDKDLRPIIIDVLTTMMRDSDVENRRSALQTFNTAARNKPRLILPYLSSLVPLVIDQTFEDPALIREVSMGPFKHQVDDGLEVRKSAYETMYSVMEIAASRVDLIKVYDRVVAGIKDETGIRTVCILMLGKLVEAAPEETIRRLDDISDQCRVVLAITPKENAVRQEHDRADEAKRNVVKLSIDLMRAFPVEAGGAVGGGAGSRLKWSNYLDDLKKDHVTILKEVEREMKEKERIS